MSDQNKNTTGAIYTPKFTRKGDTTACVGDGTMSIPEDWCSADYGDTAGASAASVVILAPEAHPAMLRALIKHNNTLAQCVEAMEVNIEGTGHKIVKVDDAEDNESERVLLESFFKEPYPGKTMTSIRRALRRDLESTGCGYLEVLRDADGGVALIDRIPAQQVRLLRLDDAVSVQKQVTRNGKEIPLTMTVRERRFVRRVGNKKVYYAEFGASRKLDATTGKWLDKDGKVPGAKASQPVVASQIIFFKLGEDLKGVYGAPRWMNQIPAVLGSRKAEELNLDYFDAGGLPPALIFVQGGTLGASVTDQLNALFSGGPTVNSRVAVVEAVSTSGGIDSAGAVNVRVERFGSERASDGMFSNYDSECRAKVRRAFRLPPIFLGDSTDYNFATATTAYMVAEAQVFLPEREEFDNVINTTIVRALGVKNYQFKSLPLTLVDVEKQLRAIELVKDSMISGEDVVQLLNEVVGLNMEYNKQDTPKPETNPPVAGNDAAGEDPTKVNAPGTVSQAPASAQESASNGQITKAVKLASEFGAALYKDHALSEDLLDQVGALTPAERLEFASTLTNISGLGDNFSDILYVAHQLSAKAQHEAECGCGGDHED